MLAQGKDDKPKSAGKMRFGAARVRLSSPYALGDFPKDELYLSLTQNRREDFLADFIHATESVPEKTVFIFDDFHQITNEEVQSSVRFLCRNLPRGIGLILSGRSRLPFSLTGLAAEDRFHIITENRLQFKKDEIRLLAEEKGCPLSDEDAGLILRQTAGWPICASLVLQALADGSTLSAGMDTVTGTGSVMWEYLASELLSKLEPRLREFMYATSVLPYLTPDGCEAVLRSVGMADYWPEMMLQEMWNSRESLFVERIGESRYRCHSLIRKVMISELKSSSQTKYLEACRAAAGWLMRHGDETAAIDISLKSRDYHAAAELILANYSKMVMEGEAYLLNSWLDRLPNELFKEYSRLHLVKAWALFPSGNVREAESHLRIADRELANEKAGSIVNREIAALRALNSALLQFDCKESLAFSTEAQADGGADRSPEVEVSGWLASGVAHLLQSEPVKAEEELKKAASCRRDMNSIFFSYFGKYYLAILEQKKGHLRKAEKLLKEALEIARDGTGKERSISGIAHISLSRIYYEWNRPEDCLLHVKEGLARSDEWSLPSNLSSGYHTLSLVSRLMGDMETASLASRRSYDFGGDSTATPFITHESLPSLRGRVDRVEMGDNLRWAGEYLARIKENGTVSGEELWQMPAALHLYIAAGGSEDLDFYLDELLRSSEKVGFCQQVIETQVIRAILLSERGKRSEALLALGNALELAQNEGYTRVFLDEGEQMRLLLKEAQARNIVPSYTSRLLRAFEEERPGGAKQELLSPREIEVLELLSQGFNPKQIAEALFISVGTTRSHLHHIYEKLGAGNQIQAIRIGKEKHLIK